MSKITQTKNFSVENEILQVSCVVVLIQPLGNRVEDKYKLEIISFF